MLEMRSSVVLWLLASGCDLVVSLDPPPATACGQFDSPTEVPFATDLPKLVGFSPVGERALARTTDTPPHVLALKLDAGVWVRDPLYQGNLETLYMQTRLHYGQLTFEGKMFGGVRDATNPDYYVYLYRFAAPQWVIDEPMPIAFSTGVSVLPGGSLITGENENEYKYHVTTQTMGTERKVIVVVKTRAMTSWMTEAVSGLPTTAPINETHDVIDGAIALAPAPNDRPALVYAAKLRTDSGSSDLYVSQKNQGVWQVGVPLDELSVDGEDEVEPYVNADCSLLYFRRGDKIFQARAHGR
jgi:hypothetical protein